MTSVYLDYNATAPVYPEALAAMQEVLAMPANASSVHAFGREAKKKLEAARAVIADTISAWGDEIIFTASGSEANTMALKGSGRPTLVSAVEHSSVLKSGEELIPTDGNGIVNLAWLERNLSENPQALVSVMLANNETGAIQPVAEVSALCRKYGALLHCDAVQGLGKIPVDFGAFGVDMMTLSAHKCGGPVGAAALVIKRGTVIAPLIPGGGQELGRRAGTENIAAIVGFAKAVEKIDLVHMRTLRGWLNEMETQMRCWWRNVEVFGDGVDRLPNTSCVAMPGVSNEVQLMDFDLKGFAVSAGSACSSGRVEISHVLSAMHVPKEQVASAIRVSGGWRTTEADIKNFTEAWKATCKRLAK